MAVLMPQPSLYWDYRCAWPHPAVCVIFEVNVNKMCCLVKFQMAYYLQGYFLFCDDNELPQGPSFHRVGWHPEQYQGNLLAAWSLFFICRLLEWRPGCKVNCGYHDWETNRIHRMTLNVLTQDALNLRDILFRYNHGRLLVRVFGQWVWRLTVLKKVRSAVDVSTRAREGCCVEAASSVPRARRLWESISCNC